MLSYTCPGGAAVVQLPSERDLRLGLFHCDDLGSPLFK